MQMAARELHIEDRSGFGESEEIGAWGQECGVPVSLFGLVELTATNWEPAAREALSKVNRAGMEKWEANFPLVALTTEVLRLKKRVMELEEAQPTVVPIETLVPEPYELLRPIHAVVRRHDDEYLATFYDAGLSASGDTDVEAVMNLRDMTVASFEVLMEDDRDSLGPGLARERDVLESFIRPVS